MNFFLPPWTTLSSCPSANDLLALQKQTPIESVDNFEPHIPVPKYQGCGADLRIMRPQTCTTAEGGTNR